MTTPNRWFPVESHTKVPFLHYLPKTFFDFLLNKLGKSWATGSYMDLVGERRLRELLRTAGFIEFELRKNRLGPFTVDFVIIF